ncbi:MAG: EamA family transporter, partial [Glaciecola sp.]
MYYLWIVTCIWAFSFSLIGVFLAGSVDPWFSGMSRVAIAFLVFLPFLFRSPLSRSLALKCVGIGAIQIGLMYSFYYHSFLYLSVPEVLLFTVMTPVYITLLNDLLSQQLRLGYLLVAILAVAGAAAMRYDTLSSDYWFGLMIVQGANLSFALGQVLYKRLQLDETIAHRYLFSWFFAGALIVTLLTFVLFGDFNALPQTTTQWSVLIYLGLIASGLGYFLWNKGVSQASVPMIAVMNNVLIPAGLVVNIVIWNRDVNLISLAIGSVFMVLALVVGQ